MDVRRGVTGLTQGQGEWAETRGPQGQSQGHPHQALAVGGAVCVCVCVGVCVRERALGQTICRAALTGYHCTSQSLGQRLWWFGGVGGGV